MCYLSSFLFLRLSAYRQSAHTGFRTKKMQSRLIYHTASCAIRPEWVGKKAASHR
jgi:hypothetical protein